MYVHNIIIQAPHMIKEILYIIFNPPIRQFRRSIAKVILVSVSVLLFILFVSRDGNTS